MYCNGSRRRLCDSRVCGCCQVVRVSTCARLACIVVSCKRSLSSSASGLCLILIETPDDDLDVTTRKVKVLCAVEIHSASIDGKLCATNRPWGLYAIARSIRQHLHVDCEENEGYNSLIRMSEHVCPINFINSTCVHWVGTYLDRWGRWVEMRQIKPTGTSGWLYLWGGRQTPFQHAAPTDAS